MTQLIQIRKSEGGKDVVSARELHIFLGAGSNINTWFKNQVERAMLRENIDYQRVQISETSGQTSFDYAIALSSAKEIAMLNGGDKGKEARLYFIECERLAKQSQTPKELSRKDILLLALESEERALALEEKLKEVQPKIEMFDMAMSSRDTLDMSEVAKILCVEGFGRNNVFKKLREKGILRENNEPFQEYVNQKWFKIVERPFNKPNGEVGVSIKTVVFQKGLDGIRKILAIN